MLKEIVPLLVKGWKFKYNKYTNCIETEHPKGGKFSICGLKPSVILRDVDGLGNMVANILNGKNLKYKLYKCTLQTKGGKKIRHIVAKDEVDAGLGVVILGKEKRSDRNIEVVEVVMDKRKLLEMST